MAAWWVFTGAPLADLVRFGPAVFGGVGLATLAVAVGRREGLLAAFVAALALAMMPEGIMRTSMLAPTALDLALLPVFLYATLELAGGRLAWVVPMAVITLFFVVAHPWVVPMLALAGFLFLAFALLFPWRAAHGPGLERRGVGLAMAVLLAGAALAASTRWDVSDSGIGDLARPALARLGPLGLLAGAIAGGVVVLALLFPERLPAPLRRGGPRTPHEAVVVAAAMAIVLVMLWAPAVEHGLPLYVDFDAMLLPTTVALAFLGLLLLPFVGSPLGLAAGALLLALLPFALYDVLNSPMWPHRTMAYLGVAAAVLAGIAADRGAALLARVLARLRHARLASGRVGTIAFAIAAPTLLVGCGAAGAMLRDAPEPPHWYRLFDACEARVLGQVSAIADADPRAVVIVDAWQTQLVVSAFASNNLRIWLNDDFYEVGFPVASYLHSRGLDRRATYVVADHYLDDEDADVDLFAHAPWPVVAQGCDAHPIVVYQVGPTA